MEFKALGHDRQKRLLTSLVEKGRLPHALLFSGPKGVGKRTLAAEFAGNLFCEEGRGCGECRWCRSLAAGTHPDFKFISGEPSIKIDAVRAIAKECYEPPFEAPLRVVLMDDADLMTREAANALLKTLEEPPPANLFILVSSREQAMPLTVRSRCMRIGFGSLPASLVQSYFEEVEGMDPQKAAGLARLAGGSIAAGLFWADDDTLRDEKEDRGASGRQQRLVRKGIRAGGEDGRQRARDGIPLLPSDIFQGRLVAPQDGR